MTVRIAHPNPHGILSEEALIKFENRFGLQLPPDYREFLLDFNGGRPVPSFFWIKAKENGSHVDRFYGVFSPKLAASLETYLGLDRHGIPSTIIPVGDDGAGDFICLALGLGWVQFGSIYFLDHGLHPVDAPDSSKGITLLARSFTDFLSALQSPPRPK